jgi:hypothetical protein
VVVGSVPDVTIIPASFAFRIKVNICIALVQQTHGKRVWIDVWFEPLDVF